MNIFPKISIVTPSYNQGQYLEKTIQSVLNQNYPNLEYIIIDGGSSDNSIEIIKKYEKHLTYWISEKDNGQSDGINKGLLKCTGDIIAWLNSDDYYEPDTFKNVVSVFSKNPDAGLLYGDCRIIYVDSEGKTLKQQIVSPEHVTNFSLMNYWKSYFLPPQPSIFWRKSIQDKTMLLNRSLNYAMDMDFWLQLSEHGNIIKANFLLANYLVHTNSKSGSEGGFSKFKSEWKLVSEVHLKNKSIAVKLKFYIKKNTYHIANYKYKKLPRIFLGFIVNLFKKITGVKKIGILKGK